MLVPWKKKKPREEAAAAPTTGAEREAVFGMGYLPFKTGETKLYEALRESIPLIDAAISKIIRLVGSFRVETGRGETDRELERFLKTVPVGPLHQGVAFFLWGYLDTLLTYGNAVGEILPTRDMRGIGALFLPPIENVQHNRGENPMETVICVGRGGNFQPVPYPELVVCSALNPPDSCSKGVSLLKGLPFVSQILLTIFQCMGNNFERAGNLRYAVTYRPGGEGGRSRERAQMIAREWAQAMSPGKVKDFVAVGDVEIKAIGADGPILDTQVPVRLILEQIVAKLGIPPFMLGLSWSSTERMSKQQSDILTSELEAYRTLLEPVIRRICGLWLRQRGESGEHGICWDTINLQDEVDEAQAMLYREQAAYYRARAAAVKQ